MANKYQQNIAKVLRGKQAARTSYVLRQTQKLKDPAKINAKTLQSWRRILYENAQDLDIGLRLMEKKSNRQRAANEIRQVYKAAYYKTLLETEYSTAYTQKLLNSIQNTLVASSFNGAWETAKLEEKADYLNELAFKFLDDFDRENIIHNSYPFNHQRLVLIETVPIEKENNPDAVYVLTDACIRFYRYFVKYLDQSIITENGLEDWVDYETTKKVYAEKRGDDTFHQPGFAFDATARDYHREYDLDTQHDFQFLTNLEDENSSVAMLAHEICHMVNFRLSIFHNIFPEKVETQFSFNKSDREVHDSSSISYEGHGELYRKNKEEVLAYLIQDKTFAMLKQKSAPAAV